MVAAETKRSWLYTFDERDLKSVRVSYAKPDLKPLAFVNGPFRVRKKKENRLRNSEV